MQKNNIAKLDWLTCFMLIQFILLQTSNYNTQEEVQLQQSYWTEISGLAKESCLEKVVYCKKHLFTGLKICFYVQVFLSSSLLAQHLFVVLVLKSTNMAKKVF